MDKDEAALYSGASDSLAISAELAFGLSTFLCVFMKVGLGSILSSVKNLQVVGHFMLFKVTVPANASIFFNKLHSLITLDPINVEAQIIDLFKL